MQNSSIWKSIQKAYGGFKFILQTHTHYRFQIITGILVIVAGFMLKISYFEWLVIIGAVFFGLIFEAFNTAIEELCNLIQKQHSYTVKIAKDISGAAVLIFVLYSIMIGLIIFLPKIMKLLIR